MAIAPAPRKRASRSKTAEPPVLPEIIELTNQQAWDRFDSYTREHLAISGDDFNAAWDRGDLLERIEEDHVLTAYFLMADPRSKPVGRTSAKARWNVSVSCEVAQTSAMLP